MEYKNKTVYTKEIYKAIENQKSFSYEMIIYKLMIISMMMWTGVRFIQQDDTNIFNWMFGGFAIVGLPLMFFGYPFLKNRKVYERSLKANDGKEITAEMHLKEDEIICRNNLGQKVVRSYQNVTEIRRTPKLLILLMDKFEPIYMDANGFKNADVDEVEEFLRNRCPNARKKKDGRKSPEDGQRRRGVGRDKRRRRGQGEEHHNPESCAE